MRWIPTGPGARRLLAVGAAALATVLVWALFLRGDDGGGEGDPASLAGQVSPQVQEVVEGMTPEEKVDGILLLGFEGTDAAAPLLEELRRRQLGGVLVSSRNWIDASQGAGLVSELRAAAGEGGRIEPLLVAPQEGGVYRAFPDLPPEDRQLNVGDFADIEFAERWARDTGEALRATGFDMNLFPIADVATLDSPIADRAFSDDATVVATMTAAAVRGCREAEIACVARHFPGLGAASQSTDQGPATVSLDRATLDARDLAAFRAAIAEQVPAVMLSHAFYAAFDPVTPASLSPATATDLLRDELGFSGVAMTDDLGVGAIKAGYSVPGAAVTAVQAGADLILIGSAADQEGVREALLAALESRDISPQRIDEAVGRVLEMKRMLGLLAA